MRVLYNCTCVCKKPLQSVLHNQKLQLRMLVLCVAGLMTTLIGNFNAGQIFRRVCFEICLTYSASEQSV